MAVRQTENIWRDQAEKKHHQEVVKGTRWCQSDTTARNLKRNNKEKRFRTSCSFYFLLSLWFLSCRQILDGLPIMMTCYLWKICLYKQVLKSRTALHWSSWMCKRHELAVLKATKKLGWDDIKKTTHGRRGVLQVRDLPGGRWFASLLKERRSWKPTQMICYTLKGTTLSSNL